MLKKLLRGRAYKPATVEQATSTTQKWETARAIAKAAEGRYRTLVASTAIALQTAKAAHAAEDSAWNDLVAERESHRNEMVNGTGGL